MSWGGVIRVELEHIRETPTCFSGEVRGLVTFPMSQSDVNSETVKKIRRKKFMLMPIHTKSAPQCPTELIERRRDVQKEV